MSKCTDPEIGALLHAYELDSLSEQDIKRFEIHLLECEHCFTQAQSFVYEAALLATDDEVRNIVSRADKAGVRSKSVLRKLWRHIWPDAPVILKPAIAYLLVLFMAIPAYRGLMYSTVADKGIGPVQVLKLVPNRSNAEEVFQISSERDGVISFVFIGALPGKSYRVVIETADGSEVKRIDNFGSFDQFGTGELIFPLVKMKVGSYRLTITDPSSESPTDEQEYLFRIKE